MYVLYNCLFLQVPGKSSVVLVSFQPSLAFCAWYCMQLLVCKAEPDIWFRDLSTQQPTANVITCAQATIITLSLDMLNNFVNLPADALLPEAAVPLKNLPAALASLHLTLSCAVFPITFPDSKSLPYKPEVRGQTSSPTSCLASCSHHSS